MMNKKVLLKYSRSKAEEPILSNVIRKTDIPLNILHANLTSEGGEIFIGMEGPEEDVNKAVELLKESGIEVIEVKHAISLDEEACVDCGACVSLCPTDALTIDEDYSIVLDEEKCVYCKECIPACPVKALEIKDLG